MFQARARFLLAAGMLLLTTILFAAESVTRVTTSKGTLVIVTDDPDVFKAAIVCFISTFQMCGMRNTLPALARTALELSTLAVSVLPMHPAAPKDSATRKIVPTFPGSCSRARSTTSGASPLMMSANS